MDLNCEVRTKSTGKVCGKPTDEEWDAQDLVDEVNEAWRISNADLEMTGPAICQDHMDVCPEV